MTRGKLMLLIVVGFALIWVTLTVFAVRHVVAMSDLANREVAPGLPAVADHVEQAQTAPLPPYPGAQIGAALPGQYELPQFTPEYRKEILAESPDKGKKTEEESSLPFD
jgi:hypothetical protein